MMCTLYRGAVLVAAVALAVAGPLFAQFPSCDDATVLGLELSGEFVAPAGVVTQIAQDLAIIRESYPAVTNISARANWEPGVLVVTLTAGAWAQYLAGTFTALDALNDEYGMTIVEEIPILETLILASQACSNPTMMVNAYGARPGVRWAEPNPYSGVADDITCTTLGWYTFRHGWMDCGAGCYFNHYWEFRVIDNAAILVSESGDPLSDESITFGAVKALFR